MITDTVFAFQVENNDHIVIGYEVIGYVYSIGGEGDTIHFDTVDDEGEHTECRFGPFESVTIVASFEEEFDND